MTIRLLDPPLHEFLPEGDIEHIVGELTTDTGMTEDEVYSRIEKLSEVNPMLGFRGCRSGNLSHPINEKKWFFIVSDATSAYALLIHDHAFVDKLLI